MLDEVTQSGTMALPIQSESEAVMVGQERWEEIRRLFFEEKVSIAEIARRLALDRKTVRRWLKKPWQPYQRAPKEETLLSTHADSSVSAHRTCSTPRRYCFRSCAVNAAIPAAMRP